MDELRERVAWAIDAVKSRPEGRGITDEDIARRLSTNKNTIGNYRRKRGLIKGIVLERLVTEYGIDADWLLRGRGEPFSGTPEAEPGKRPPAPPAMTREADGKYEFFCPGDSEAGMTVSEAIRMSIEILDSDSSHAADLRSNIRKFYRAVREEKSRHGIHESNQPALRESVEKFHKELIELEERIRSELRSALAAVRKETASRKPRKRRSRD